MEIHENKDENREEDGFWIIKKDDQQENKPAECNFFFQNHLFLIFTILFNHYILTIYLVYFYLNLIYNITFLIL